MADRQLEPPGAPFLLPAAGREVPGDHLRQEPWLHFLMLDRTPGNSMMMIAPYWHSGTWVFDDPAVGLVREPFVAGIPAMISDLVRDIPDARSGFRLLFSASPFPGHQAAFQHVRDDTGGNWYRSDLSGQEGWLCPALFKYFDQAPQTIYVRAEALER